MAHTASVRRAAGLLALHQANTWVIKQLIFCNTSGVEALIYMALGDANTPGNRFMSALPIDH